MRIVGFVWLEDVVEKLEAKHNVSPTEVAEVFAGRPTVRRMKRGRYRGEDVYRALGQTEAGRYLVAFFIYTLTHKALILSARDMDEKERRSYAG